MSKANLLPLVKLAAICTLMGGCITLGEAPDAYYLPDYAVAVGNVHPGGGPRLYLEDVDAPGLYDTYSMVVRGDSAQVSERSSTEWREKPAEFVTRKMQEHVLASQRCGFPARNSADADMIVQPILRRFDEEHTSGGWRAVFGLDLSIERSGGEPVAYIRMPDVHQAAATPDPAGVADAMAVAVQTGLDAAIDAILGEAR